MFARLNLTRHNNRPLLYSTLPTHISTRNPLLRGKRNENRGAVIFRLRSCDRTRREITWRLRMRISRINVIRLLSNKRACIIFESVSTVRNFTTYNYLNTSRRTLSLKFFPQHSSLYMLKKIKISKKRLTFIFKFRS